MKFLDPNKHPLNFHLLKEMVKKINALHNVTVVDGKGTNIGYVHLADGNTVFQINAGLGGFPWQKPYKELDPTVAVSKGTAVYISPKNPISTTGIKDLQNGNVTKAPPGIWLSLDDIPAQVTISSVVWYNVPQEPLLSDNGTVTGTPLKGDLDALATDGTPKAKWVKIQERDVCLSGI